MTSRHLGSRAGVQVRDNSTNGILYSYIFHADEPGCNCICKSIDLPLVGEGEHLGGLENSTLQQIFKVRR